jgi:D-aminopeptidase
MTKIRQLGVEIGSLPPGPLNAITDVAGTRVGHATVIRDDVRTGVTVIEARDGAIWTDYAFCGWHRFNGSAIGLTNTDQVGLVRDTLVRHSVEIGATEEFLLPVVAETYDGWLSNIHSFALTESDVRSALAAASGGPVPEGNVGGGTGMICHEFKGGIGTSSRVVAGTWTVGVLVQANYGLRKDLRIDGVPVGRIIGDSVPRPVDKEGEGSIIVVIATDAPLIPIQCRRLAQRATVGLARVGGTGRNGSGDIFLAYSTGNHLPSRPHGLYTIDMLAHEDLNPLFEAVADATEEAILNALSAAETMTGFRGRTVYELPLDRVAEILAQRPGGWR